MYTIGPFIRAKISRGLNKPRLIFARINGPNIIQKRTGVSCYYYTEMKRTGVSC
jgi:hypothetical protein